MPRRAHIARISLVGSGPLVLQLQSLQLSEVFEVRGIEYGALQRSSVKLTSNYQRVQEICNEDLVVIVRTATRYEHQFSQSVDTLGVKRVHSEIEVKGKPIWKEQVVLF